MKYYLDTCIWIDYFENRSDKFRLLGEFAFKLIKKIINDQNKIIISDKIIEELYNRYNKYIQEDIFKIIPNSLLIKIYQIDEYEIEAIKLKNKIKIPLGDIVHLIIAKKNNAIFVTRDRHFEYFENVIIKKPEELL